jgi:TonB family protein
MKRIMALLSLLVTAAAGAFAQDSRPAPATFGGMYVDGRPLIYEINVSYSGTLAGKTVDVKYSIWTPPEAIARGQIPFERRADGSVVLIRKTTDGQQTVVNVTGTVTQRRPDGSASVTKLSEIVFPESLTVTSGWIVGPSLAFPGLKLAEATFLPKRLVLGNPSGKMSATVPMTFFQIGNDYRLVLAQTPQSVPRTASPRGEKVPAPGPGVAVRRITETEYKQQARLVRVKMVPPGYPPEASTARVQGWVRMTAIIGTDGSVRDLQLVEGDPRLADAALNAVRQWMYQPPLFDGRPVEVITEIKLNFSLQ